MIGYVAVCARRRYAGPQRVLDGDLRYTDGRVCLIPTLLCMPSFPSLRGMATAQLAACAEWVGRSVVPCAGTATDPTKR